MLTQSQHGIIYRCKNFSRGAAGGVASPASRSLAFRRTKNLCCAKGKRVKGSSVTADLSSPHENRRSGGGRRDARRCGALTGNPRRRRSTRRRASRGTSLTQAPSDSPSDSAHNNRSHTSRRTIPTHCQPSPHTGMDFSRVGNTRPCWSRLTQCRYNLPPLC